MRGVSCWSAVLGAEQEQAGWRNRGSCDEGASDDVPGEALATVLEYR